MMNVCDEIIFEFINSNPIFGKPDESRRFQANDTSEDVEHILYISSSDDELNANESVFCAIDLSVDINYPKIGKFILEALEELCPSSCISTTLLLSDGFPEEEVGYFGKYLIDISNPAAKKKSITEFIDKYYQWIEPVRQKMRSPKCLADFEFHPNPERNTLPWEIQRLAYLYLYEKNALKYCIKHFKETFVLYTQELDKVEAELTEEDMDFLAAKENKIVNMEMYFIRKSAEAMKKMFSVLEKYLS